MQEPMPKLKTILWRGWRQRCPRCGEGRIYRGWVSLHDHCPHCHLQYLRDQGDLWAYLVAADRALFIFPMVIMIYFRLYIPDSNWFYVLVAALLVGFVYTLPHRNGMCLGADYLIRRRWGDLADEVSQPTADRPPDK
jgi:uncharacterized protein (DUF983 family)